MLNKLVIIQPYKKYSNIILIFGAEYLKKKPMFRCTPSELFASGKTTENHKLCVYLLRASCMAGLQLSIITHKAQISMSEPNYVKSAVNLILFDSR